VIHAPLCLREGFALRLCCGLEQADLALL
jgi:hypothetical protein